MMTTLKGTVISKDKETALDTEVLRYFKLVINIVFSYFDSS